MGGRRDGEAWCGHAGMAELRTFGTQEEPDRLLGHVERRHVLALLKVALLRLVLEASEVRVRWRLVRVRADQRYRYGENSHRKKKWRPSEQTAVRSGS